MTYTTGTMSGVTSFDDLVLPRGNFRLLVLGANLIRFGILAAALVAASMRVTWMMLDSIDIRSQTLAQRPAGRTPEVLASSRDMPEIAASSSALARILTDPGRIAELITDAKPPPVTPAPRVAPPPTVTATFGMTPLPTLITTPEAASLPPVVAPSIAPAPPVVTTPGAEPPPPVAVAPSVAPLPPVVARPAAAPDAAPTVVPLPPKRPPGALASVTVPPAGALPPSPNLANHEIARPPSRDSGQQIATAPNTVTNPVQQDNRSAFQRLLDALRQPFSSALPGAGSRTAVYDIAAHTVYMPNGDRLEAHSGLGNRFDDPHYVNAKDIGATPPNVYDLELRRDLFHGVAALRLNPVGDGNMYGRVGLLAHTYMLGPRGDSNGCVSFRDYSKFLHAFLSGEVSHLLVVTKLEAAPFSLASARERQ
jgi:hypothetical protein